MGDDMGGDIGGDMGNNGQQWTTIRGARCICDAVFSSFVQTWEEILAKHLAWDILGSGKLPELQLSDLGGMVMKTMIN